MSLEQQDQQASEPQPDIIALLAEHLEPVRMSYRPPAHQKRPFTLNPSDSGTTQPIPPLEVVRRKNMPFVAPDGREIEPAPPTQPLAQIVSPDGKYAFPAPVTRPLPIVNQATNVKAEFMSYLRRQPERIRRILKIELRSWKIVSRT